MAEGNDSDEATGLGLNRNVLAILLILFIWMAWGGVALCLVDFCQRFMTLAAARRSAVPLRLLEWVPLLLPAAILLVLATRRWRALVIYAACAGVFLCSMPWLRQHDLFYRLENPYNDRRFDAALWQAQAGSDAFLNPRGQMTADLLANQLRAGMTRDEVLNLLGTPELGSESGDSLSYILGLYSGIIDHEFLTLRFQDGKLVSAYVWES